MLSDLREGKLTMPLILAAAGATAEEKNKISRVLKERRFESVSPFEILGIVDRYDGVSKTRALARERARRARAPERLRRRRGQKMSLVLAADSIVERAS